MRQRMANGRLKPAKSGSEKGKSEAEAPERAEATVPHPYKGSRSVFLQKKSKEIFLNALGARVRRLHDQPTASGPRWSVSTPRELLLRHQKHATVKLVLR